MPPSPRGGEGIAWPVLSRRLIQGQPGTGAGRDGVGSRGGAIIELTPDRLNLTPDYRGVRWGAVFQWRIKEGF